MPDPHFYTITDDTVCENTTETFVSSISPGDGTAQFVHVTQPQAMITKKKQNVVSFFVSIFLVLLS